MQQPNWETFRAVAEVGSISGAARVLNLSQSAVSQKIQQLEDQYGTSLLVRSTQGVRLTAAGEVLYRYVVKLLHTLDEAHDRVRALADERPGPIKVGASLTISRAARHWCTGPETPGQRILRGAARAGTP